MKEGLNLNLYIHDLPKEIGATAMKLEGAPVFTKKVRLHIVALGDVGTTMLLGFLLTGGDVIESIGISDINEKNVQRLEMEMNQIRYPFADFPGSADPVLPNVVPVTEDELFACDVFVFCASKGVPPVGVQGDVRMAQLEANRSIIRHYASLAKKAAYQGLVCIVSDPVDPLCQAFLAESALAPVQIRGYGLGVMHARACYYAQRDARFARYLREGRAFGPHGEDLVLADSLRDYDDAVSKALTEKVIHANIAVRDLGYKPYLAPALSSAALSILLTLRGQWHYSSLYLGSTQGGAFFGLKNKLEKGQAVYEDACLVPPLYERLKKAYVHLLALP